MAATSAADRDRTVVLVHPHAAAGRSVQPWCDLPLELIAVGSPLVRAGYRVRIIDQRIDAAWRESLDRELAHGVVCVGVTSTTGPQLRHALEVSQAVKSRGEVPVVWGGTHATLPPEQTVERPEIDFVVQGESERTFEELVAALDGGGPVDGIPGVWSKQGGRAVSAGTRPFKRTHPAATAAARIHAPVARFRMRHMLYRAPVEIAAARKLGLYDHAG